MGTKQKGKHAALGICGSYLREMLKLKIAAQGALGPDVLF